MLSPDTTTGAFGSVLKLVVGSMYASDDFSDKGDAISITTTATTVPVVMRIIVANERSIIAAADTMTFFFFFFLLLLRRFISVPSMNTMDKRLFSFDWASDTEKIPANGNPSFSIDVCLQLSASMRSSLLTKTKSCAFIAAISFDKLLL